MANTLGAHQIADAITTVPGVSVEMLSHVASGSFSTASTSFVDIDAEFEATFQAPVSGLYFLAFSADMFFSDAGGGGRYQLVFDAAGTPQTVGVDDKTWDWQQATASNREYRCAFATVELTAGSHTVKPQWKHTQGTGTIQLSSNSGMMLWGVAISGSGAGGTIVVSDSPSATVPLPAGTPGALTDVFTLPVTVNGPDDSVHILGNVTLRPAGDSTAEHEVNFYLYDDTTYLNEQVAWKRESAAVGNLDVDDRTMPFVVTGLSAGAHTLKIKGQVWTAATGFNVLASSFAKATIFRGGRVPVLSEGSSVEDTPRATDYGSGLAVTTDTNVVSVKTRGLWRYMTPTDLPTGAAAPEAVWQFDGTGSSLNDRTANGHNWTASASVLYTAAEGLVGLWNNDAYRLTNDVPAGLITDGAFTFVALASIHRGGDTIFIAAQTGGSVQYQCRIHSDLKFRGYHQSAGPVNQPIYFDASMLFGPVQHVTFTRAGDGITQEVFVDGQLLDTQVAGAAPDSGSPATGVEGLAASGTPYGEGAFFSMLLTLEKWSAAQVLEHYQFCRRLV